MSTQAVLEARRRVLALISVIPIPGVSSTYSTAVIVAGHETMHGSVVPPR